MSEQQQFEGDRWTKQTIKILSELGWVQIGSSNFDIPCVNKALHSTGERERKNDHGIDSFFNYHDPYLNTEENIIVESKKRKWSGITKTNVQKFTTQLLNTLECANLSPKLQELGYPPTNVGLLMIWCDEVNEYDYEKIKEYLSEVKTPNKKTPITIFIATNHEILRWCSLIEQKNELLQNSEDFNFFYPSEYYRNGRSMSSQKKHVNLIQMYSSYIFAKSRRKILIDEDTTKTIDIHHVFFFAEATKEELDFLYELLGDFQFEDAHELHIHFYGEQTKYRENIEEFLRRKKEKVKSNKHQLKIKIKYMDVLNTVPEKYNVLED
ncbi:hypothetical protein Q7A53_02020 [Halobacillus rhizosphaerae]|uniref:hypothetical protein n=1 Tax=Halobacillus rhizosphaerae TaxID=3064889 RepID=UPI00398B83D1